MGHRFFIPGHIFAFLHVLLATAIANEHAEQAKQPEQTALTTATFGGGCFWCLQPVFADLEGVSTTTVGFMGGHVDNPTYNAVSSGKTGHAEVVTLTYDPAVIGYAELLEVYWHNVDYTPSSGAVDGHNSQYRSVLFTYDQQQRATAEASKAALQTKRGSQETILTTIEPAQKFYPAAELHQHYYRKSSNEK